VRTKPPSFANSAMPVRPPKSFEFESPVISMRPGSA
jgi:hypothetical protein